MSERHEENRAKAERWLRVGEAMEAVTLVLVPPMDKEGSWTAFSKGNMTPAIAPDPLTAAERAMGVADAS